MRSSAAWCWPRRHVHWDMEGSHGWRGRPLVSYEVVLHLIGATTTRSGLRVQAELDSARYPTKVKVPDAEMARLQITPHPFHGDWNYTLAPTAQTAHL